MLNPDCNDRISGEYASIFPEAHGSEAIQSHAIAEQAEGVRPQVEQTLADQDNAVVEDVQPDVATQAYEASQGLEVPFDLAENAVVEAAPGRRIYDL
jgi:hypothetical protein